MLKYLVLNKFSVCHELDMRNLKFIYILNSDHLKEVVRILDMIVMMSVSYPTYMPINRHLSNATKTRRFQLRSISGSCNFRRERPSSHNSVWDAIRWQKQDAYH